MRVKAVGKVNDDIDLIVTEDSVLCAVCVKARYGVEFLKWDDDMDAYCFARKVMQEVEKQSESSVIKDFFLGYI